MSKTYCRFCDITAEGLYVNCPRCGNYLPPVGEGPKTPPEPFTLVAYGESCSIDQIKSVGEDE